MELQVRCASGAPLQPSGANPENAGNQSSIDRIENLPDSLSERQSIYEEGLAEAKSQGDLKVDQSEITAKLDEIKVGTQVSEDGYRYKSFSSKNDALSFLESNSDWFAVDGIESSGNVTIYATATSSGTQLQVGSQMASYLRSGLRFGRTLTSVENVIQTIAHETGHTLGYGHGDNMLNREFRAIKNYR